MNTIPDPIKIKSDPTIISSRKINELNKIKEKIKALYFSLVKIFILKIDNITELIEPN